MTSSARSCAFDEPEGSRASPSPLDPRPIAQSQWYLRLILRLLENAWSELFTTEGLLSSFLELNDPKTRDAKAAHIFSRIDADGSGVIDSTELKDAMYELGIELTDDTVAQMILTRTKTSAIKTTHITARSLNSTEHV